jgi:hypothetical protein
MIDFTFDLIQKALDINKILTNDKYVPTSFLKNNYSAPWDLIEHGLRPFPEMGLVT